MASSYDVGDPGPFLCGTDHAGHEKKSPLLTLNQTVLLLAAILPRPEFDAQTALDWVAYYQATNLAAKISHRKRRLERLNQRE